MEDNKNTVYNASDELYGKKINAIPKPTPQIGIDTDSTMFDNIIEQGVSGSAINMAEINNFTRISEDRDTLYKMLEGMSKDVTVSAIIETYAEDCTEASDSGRIMWCEAENPDISNYINFLLDIMNVDKNIYKWISSLIVFGDVYLRLYRKSDMEDHLFNSDELNKLDRISDKKALHEDIKFNKYTKTDNYTHYVEMVPNPAEMFELTKFGKTYGYIKAEIDTTPTDAGNIFYKYKFNKKDIDVFEATEFVHGSLDDNISRVSEEVNIYNDDNETDKYTYTVKRGQSLLYPLYKIWREMNLLETSMLLNRLTKSGIVRVINVEVGDMAKENVGPHLQRIKALIEQKAAINTGVSMEEYTNPGPIDNNVYVPTRQGIGALSTQQIGGDVDVKGIADIDYYQNKFFGGFRVPKQYFSNTDDGAGFNGGQSLTILSSRYAKAVKRIQNTAIQMITDAINLQLLDSGMDSYVGQFSLKMMAPTTQEEIDRRDNMANKVQLASDIMNMLDDIENPQDRLKVLKSLLSTILNDTEILDIIQEQIDNYDSNNVSENNQSEEEGPDFGGGMPRQAGGRPAGGVDMNEPLGLNDMSEEPELEPTSEEEGPAEETILPTGNDLNVDLTNSQEFP